jgi:hypothetical protein
VSVPSAVAFLWTRTVKNRVLSQWRRLKNPRYLIAAAAGAAYFYWIIISRFLTYRGPADPPDAQGRIFVEAVMLGMALLTVLGSWVLGSNKSPLHYTEAEVQYLFAGPLSRRSVLHYRLVKSVLRTGFSALIATLFFRGAWGASSLLFGIGAWGSFTALSLHGTGAALVRESLFTHGRFGWPRRLLTLLVMAAALGALGWWAARGQALPDLDALTAEGLATWIDTLLSARPLSWVLFPLRAPIRLALSPSWAEAWPMLLATLGVIAVLYAWVVSTGLSFEEAAVEAASERARRVEMRRATRSAPGLLRKVKSTSLWLPARGPSWIAVTWKNLVAARRVSGLVVVLMVLWVGLGILVVSRIRPDPGASFVPMVGASIAVSLAVFFSLFGPSMLEADLRQDLRMVDVLRTLPLTGRQLVLGEILAPALILTGMQWLLLLLGAAIAARVPLPWVDGPGRAVVVISAMLFCPALSLAGLCVQNAAAVVFPAWMSGEARTEGRGFEAMGQRLLTLAGSMVVLTVGLIPSTVLGTLAGLGAAYFVGISGAILGAAVASAVLLLECWLALRLLGTLFERFDLSE